jgi:hypothetical protein
MGKITSLVIEILVFVTTVFWIQFTFESWKRKCIETCTNVYHCAQFLKFDHKHRGIKPYKWRDFMMDLPCLDTHDVVLWKGKNKKKSI